MRSVTDWLDSSALSDMCACANPLHARASSLERLRDACPGEMQALADLFLLGREIPERRLDSIPAAVVADLEECGVLTRDSGCVSLGGLVLRWVTGLWLLSQRPQVNPTLYFGDDSVALMQRLTCTPGMRALDLCAGPGIQALRLAAMGAHVVAVEVNPVAAALAGLNARLNRLADRIEICIGDLYEPVEDLCFDRICCNPPLLPFPDELPYPFVGHGGPDGLRVTRRVLNGLPRALRETGSARLLGTTLSDGYVPNFVDELQAWSASRSMDVRVFVTSHHRLAPGSPFFEGLCDTAAGTGGVDGHTARAVFLRRLTETHATHLCAYFLHVVHGSGVLTVLDGSGDTSADLWFVSC